MEPKKQKTPNTQGRKASALRPPASRESTQLQMSSDAPTRGRHRPAQSGTPTMMQEVGESGLMLDVDRAMDEITRIPAAVIHRDAAFAWASRAIAGYRVCSAKNSIEEGLSYLYLGEHYREAALAHAAMGEVWEFLFTEIDDAMAGEREQAFASIRALSSGATR